MKTVIASGGYINEPLFKYNLASGLLIADDFGIGSNPDVVYSVNPANGVQTLISDLSNPAQGPVFPHLDAGDLVIEPSGNYLLNNFVTGVIYRIDPATGNRTLYTSGGFLTAGTPAATFMAIDNNGDLLVAVQNPATPNGAIVRINHSTLAQTVITSGGFSNLAGLSVAADGSILVGDEGPQFGSLPDGVVYQINPTTGARSVIASGGFLAQPLDVLVELSGTILVGDYISGLVRLTAGAARNVISGNTGDGVLIGDSGTTGNVVEGNYIGTNAGGTAALGNGSAGVSITATGNTVGGPAATPGTGVGNVISGNAVYGVKLQASSVVEGNLIGTNAAGTSALGNGDNTSAGAGGIYILAGGGINTNDTIGGASAGDGNVISGNNGHGVNIVGGSGNTVQGNSIGIDITGEKAIPNAIGGVVVYDSSNNLIGGPTSKTGSGAGNVISGNNDGGASAEILFDNGNAGSSLTFGNIVQGNLIGTNSTGNAVPIGASASLGGVKIIAGAAANFIGGTSAGMRNVVSGNAFSGMEIDGATSTGNTIQGNYIGTDVSGTADLGNGSDGVSLEFANNNMIGGGEAGAGNVISGNGIYGVLIDASFIAGQGQGNKVQGNIIGLDKTGMFSVGGLSGNNLDGVYLFRGATGNYIGTDSDGVDDATEGNTISGSRDAGVLIGEVGTTANIVAGNFIGTNRLGVGPVANGSEGVRIENAASGNTIGGTTTGAGNTIAFNAVSGVLVTDTASGNRIRENSIFANAGKGIDLGTGTQYGLARLPVLTAGTVGPKTRIAGTLNGSGSTVYAIDIFANDRANPSGFGDGQIYLGSTTVTTNGFGTAAINIVLPVQTARIRSSQ